MPLYRANRIAIFDAVCLVTDVVGDWVRISGPLDVNGFRQVTKVDITDPVGKMPAVGMIIEKPIDTECVVQTFGEVEPGGAALTPNKRYFIDRTSRTADAPPAPNLGEKVAAQVVGVALDEAILDVALNLYFVVQVG